MRNSTARRRGAWVFAAIAMTFLFGSPASAYSPRCQSAANAFNRVKASANARCVAQGYRPGCGPILRRVIRSAKYAVAICAPELSASETAGMQAFIARGEGALSANISARGAARRSAHPAARSAPAVAAPAAAPVGQDTRRVIRDERLPPLLNTPPPVSAQPAAAAHGIRHAPRRLRTRAHAPAATPPQAADLPQGATPPGLRPLHRRARGVPRRTSPQTRGGNSP
jgi:hypothetical protein